MVVVEAVGNAEGSTTWDSLRSMLRVDSIVSVRCAVSYVMKSGVAIARREIKPIVDSGVAVTIVFGDDFRLSESGALASLISIGCQLRLHSGETHPGYHPKMWVVDCENGNRAVLVGSSNLSGGGLRGNAEANVLLRGSTEELDAFDQLWQSFYDDSHVFSHKDLESYVDSERAAAVPHRAAGASTSAARAGALVHAHIERWQRFIADPHRIGQHERWRGWYLVPEQGQLTIDMLKKLASVLRQIRARPQYRREGQISLGTDNVGVANAVAVVRGVGITTLHPFSDRKRRNLFVRQQRLYLQTFGFLEMVGDSTFRITDSGKAFQAAPTDARRVALFTEALSLKKWPFGPIAFYPFLLEVIERVPDRRIYYDEMNLIVIHSYHRAERQGIVNLVAAYRGLPAQERERLAKEADQRLRVLLARHAGGTAYGRYRRKLADLMVAFGTTTPLRYVDAEPEDRSYIEVVGLKQLSRDDG
jgi:HKD family nuclease